MLKLSRQGGQGGQRNTLQQAEAPGRVGQANSGRVPEFYPRVHNKEVVRMELVPWEPFGELRTLRRETEDFWSRSFDEPPFPRLVLEEWVPWVDISETKGNFVVKAELPGMEAKDINVSISGNVLTIKGEKKKEQEEKDEHYLYCERYCGFFHRSFRLPVAVQSDKLERTFRNGILRVTLPKAEEAKKKEIEIKVG